MAFGFKHGSKNIIKFIAKPTVTGAYTFDNSQKTAVINGYDSKAMTMSGTNKATKSGTYSITFTLNKGYAWIDKTKAAVTRTWSIAKRKVTIPTMTNTSYTWAVNSMYKPSISGVDANYVTQSGTVSSSNAGSWVVTWALKYPSDTTWSDGNTANKTGSWTVNKRTLAIPSISGTKSFAYIEGTTRSVSVVGLDSVYETQSGSTSASAQNTYTITWALRYPTNTQWSGGTTTNKSESWSIAWVNGTSHYNNDLYNRGWLKSNSMTFADTFTTAGVLNWNADNFEICGKMFKLSDAYSEKTFHVVLAMAARTGSPTIPSTVRLLEFKGGSDWGYYSANKPGGSGSAEYSVGTGYLQLDGVHSSSNVRYFGVRNSSGVTTANTFYYRIQRIWIT